MVYTAPQPAGGKGGGKEDGEDLKFNKEGDVSGGDGGGEEGGVEVEEGGAETGDQGVTALDPTSVSAGSVAA